MKCDKEFVPTHSNQKKFCSRECQGRFNIKVWRKNNPSQDAKHKRIYNLKKKYGLTEQEYNILFDKQNGRCNICMRTSERRLDVDHDHQSGKIRGLLCNPCNQGIGLLQHDPLIIKSALAHIGVA